RARLEAPMPPWFNDGIADADAIRQTEADLRRLLAKSEEDEREIERLAHELAVADEAVKVQAAELALREQRISQLQALHSNDTEALQHEIERLRKANEEVSTEKALTELRELFLNRSVRITYQ